VCYCVGVVFVIVWGVVFVIVWELCLLLCGGCVFYCVGVVFVFVIFFGGCSNLITYFGMNLVRFDVGPSSGVVCVNLRSVHSIRESLIVSHFFCPSFWCVIIVFEVH